MTQALAVVHQSTGLAFSTEQKQLIRDTYANGATDAEFAVLMEIARARGLNPLLRQIHFVKRYDSQRRRDVWSAQASIDGMRAIAERTSKYNGQDEPEYEVDQAGKLVSCKVRVYRKDWDRPAVGVAYWDEYVQKTREGETTRFWKQMPRVMLAKCAEAIALRKAFPEDLSGLYEPAEMAQATRDAQEPPPPPTISPFHEADPERVYPTQDELDAVLDALNEAESFEALRTCAHEFAWRTPEEMEQWHPDQVKAISKLFNSRKRQFQKAEAAE